LSIDAQTWIKMARQLPLSRVEQEVLRRFQEDPSGRQFLPLGDLLRNHKLIDESLELLTQGVQDHPGFAVARVVLVRELFQRGLVLDAWTTLDKAPSPLTDNVLAQKLKFKMSILLGDESSARSAMQCLKIQQGIDPEIKKISEQLERDGLLLTREAFRNDLIKRGVDLRMPHIVELSAQVSQSSQFENKTVDSSRFRGARFVLEYNLDDNVRKHVENFHVVPLQEVFIPGGSEGSETPKSNQVELDSTTLAEIYAKQGFYSKALAIYRRLLRMAPHNDLIRMKVSETARLDKEQRHDDLESDPVIYDRMEVTDVIDRQVRFMRAMLDKLEQP